MEAIKVFFQAFWQGIEVFLPIIVCNLLILFVALMYEFLKRHK